MTDPHQPPFVIPAGTQVVLRVEIQDASGARLHPHGAVGIVVKAPADATHSYRVRFPDGFEASLKRVELDVRKTAPREALADAGKELASDDLFDRVIYRVVIGSRAYGLDHAESDTDRRGVYLPPAERHWSLFGVPEQLENDASQECYWELQKFLTMALKANPNVLECLWSPLVETATPLAQEMLAMRGAFLSKMIYQTYNGYVMSQFRKLEQDLRNQGGFRWKHAMHLVRLLLSGVTALREGRVPVRVEEHRERLLAIRRGETPWIEVDGWRVELHKEFDEALASSPLPDRPDYEAVNAFLVRARRSAAIDARPVVTTASPPAPPNGLIIDPRAVAVVREQPHRLIFATVSGAHHYGFPSPDSDWDLRGAHVLPIEETSRLDVHGETVQSTAMRDGLEVDLVTHDVRKFFQMVLKRNGYVLEQIFSPIVVATSPAHEELKSIATRCITKHHAHHYFGFAATERALFRKEDPPRVKPLLYIYRVLLTGIHLMKTGEILAHLPTLAAEAKLEYLHELMRFKIEAKERAVLAKADLAFHEREHERLEVALEEASQSSTLPEAPQGRAELDDLLVRIRLGRV
ncbi:MAG: nucleotidyltransferase domain-containing protein [Planctomycetota bacterium]